MPYRVTFCGLLLTFSAIGCGHKDRPAVTAPIPAAPTEVAPVEAKCVPTSPDETARGPWLDQLPKILRFEFKTVSKVGLVAEPSCVNDQDHTPDWNDVIRYEGFFTTPKFQVLYAPSAKHFLDERPSARRHVVTVKRTGSRWVGTISEIKRDPDLFGAVVDALIDYVLPSERELNLRSCTKAQMDQPTIVPEPPTPTCPKD